MQVGEDKVSLSPELAACVCQETHDAGTIALATYLGKICNFSILNSPSQIVSHPTVPLSQSHLQSLFSCSNCDTHDSINGQKSRHEAIHFHFCSGGPQLHLVCTPSNKLRPHRRSSFYSKLTWKIAWTLLQAACSRPSQMALTFRPVTLSPFLSRGLSSNDHQSRFLLHLCSNATSLAPGGLLHQFGGPRKASKSKPVNA